MKKFSKRRINRMITAIIAAMTALMVMGCAVEENGSDADSSIADSSIADSSIAGTYVYEFEEEIGEDTISMRNELVLNADHSCEYTAQDTVTGEWTDSEIILSSGSVYSYKINGDELTMDQDGLTLVFEKQ